MALTRSKRGRGKGGQITKTIARKSSAKGYDNSCGKKDASGPSNGEEIQTNDDIDKEQLLSRSKTSGGAVPFIIDTTGVSSAGTSGEQSPVQRGAPLTATADMDDSDSDSSSNNSGFHFVIDAKPDSQLNVRDDDYDIDEDHDSASKNMNFVIDKTGTSGSLPNRDEPVEIYVHDAAAAGVQSQKSKRTVQNKNKSKSKKEGSNLQVSLEAPCEIDVGLDLGDSYINFEGDVPASSKTNIENVLLKSQQDKLIKKSVLTPDFEKRHSIPPYKVGIRQLKKQRKKERESTKGDGWFGMKAQEMTDELRNDLKIVRMRSTLDPKRFYKGNDMAAIPKFVQVGTVVDSPIDFYHSRIPKKQRKQNLVDELLADADTRRYNKRKYLELQERFNNFTKGGKKRKFGKKNDGRKR